ncbi:HDOD domain-containing protein [Marinobacter fonticola]|uniref:HDOD domain-containing protein n=1 Tax=Marinobacter fonticola TaxID=2603215 RepID=UPI0011E7C7E5|nr:HDOD domain-containing protein [Marinobacter fonticola]
MSAREQQPIRRLREFQPLGRLTDEQLILLSSRAEKRKFGPGQRVIERGVKDGLEYFLLDGEIKLEAVDGRTTTILAGSDKARHPVARLQPRMYTVTAATSGEFLIVAQDVLNQLLRSAPVTENDVEETAVGGGDDGSEAHDLLMEFYADLRSNKLALPSVSDVAWKVRRATDRDDSTAEQIAQVIAADPSISAKLVRACNSPLYRGFSDVRTVRESVVRLGTRTTRQLVTVFSMREVFKSQRPELQGAMDRLWRQSREVAALCWVLADAATNLDPEEALLAGLLHDLGAIPVIVHAEHHVEIFADRQLLDRVIDELKPDIGAALLERWEFPASFVTAARHAEDWMYQPPQEELQLVDVVILAQLHAMIRDRQGSELPRFETVPAYRRLGELELSASRSLEILNQAQERIDEVQKLLSIH